MDISMLLLIVSDTSAYAIVISIIQCPRRLLAAQLAIDKYANVQSFQKYNYEIVHRWIAQFKNSKNHRFFRIIISSNNKIDKKEIYFKLESSKHSACHLDAITKAIGIGKYLIGAARRKGKARRKGVVGTRGKRRRKRLAGSSSSRLDIRQICPWSMRAAVW